jgi:hypothetical protein
MEGGLAFMVGRASFSVMLSSGSLTKADEIQTEIFRRMSPSRKLELAIAMQEQARALMDSGLKLSHPQFTESKRRRAIARRILNART